LRELFGSDGECIAETATHEMDGDGSGYLTKIDCKFKDKSGSGRASS